MTRRKLNTIFLFSLLCLYSFISIGYAALQQSLLISGDVEYVYNTDKLYDVLKREAFNETYANEYTNPYQDSMDGGGTEKIFYWNAPNTTEGNALAMEIKEKWNVIFAGHCWQMFRTTSTGGIKMIYNGLPNNGTCTNDGASQSIGTSKYNVNYSSLADVGYMYNTRYTDSWVDNYSLSKNDSIYQGSYMSSSGNYYYGTGVTYDSSTAKYTLTGTSQATWANTYASSSGLYTCKTTNNAPCSKVYYIAFGNSNYMYGFEMADGNMLNYYNTNLVFGTSYTKSGNTYTLNNTSTVRKGDWYNNYTNYNSSYYTCGDNRTSCTNLRKVFTTSNSGYSYLEEIVYANSFTYDNSTNTYKLSTSNRVQYFDHSEHLSDLANYHYTCFSSSDTCTELKYMHYYFTSNGHLCYIKLTGGAGVNDAMNEMLYANNVNTVNSTIKTTIDNWYEQNLLAYAYMLEDVILCNNRTIINSSENGWNPNGGNLRTAIVFKSSSVSGDLSCSNDTDKFSISNNKAKLTYPIGLPSSEEMSLLENRLLLYIGQNYWLASPASFTNEYYVIHVSYVDGNIHFTGGNSYTSAYVRPTISLKAGTKFASGNGTTANPYIVDTT